MKRWIITLIALAPTIALATAVTQGFNTKTPLAAGTVVSLNKNPEVVTPTTKENLESLIGVVVSSDSSVFSTAESAEQALVATSGTANVFVSNAEGDIKVGDRITVGALAGVGVKAKNSARILGVAQGSFDKSTAGAQKDTVTDTGGGKHDIYVGQVPVLIGVTYYTALAGEAGKSSFLPAALQDVANVVAGKVVSPFAVIVSLVILLITFGVSSMMLNGAVRGGMVSIGRNPLAKKDVYKGLFGVIGFSVATIVAGILVASAVLRYL